MQMFLLIEEAKEIVLDFWIETVKVLYFYFALIYYQYKITYYNTLNAKLSNSQLNRLNAVTKNGTEVTLNLSSNVICDSNYETNFPNKLLLTDTQVSMIRKAFANGSSTTIKF